MASIATDKTVKKQSKPWQFKPGESPNPKGRPKGSSYMAELNKAIKEVEAEKKKSFFKRVVERAYISDSVLIAILKKFIPDKLRQEFEGLEGLEITIKHDNGKDRS